MVITPSKRSSFVSSPLREITSDSPFFTFTTTTLWSPAQRALRGVTEELRRTISVRRRGLPASSRTIPEIITADAPSVEATIAMRAPSCETFTLVKLKLRCQDRPISTPRSRSVASSESGLKARTIPSPSAAHTQPYASKLGAVRAVLCHTRRAVP